MNGIYKNANIRPKREEAKEKKTIYVNCIQTVDKRFLPHHIRCVVDKCAGKKKKHSQMIDGTRTRKI